MRTLGTLILVLIVTSCCPAKLLDHEQSRSEVKLELFESRTTDYLVDLLKVDLGDVLQKALEKDEEQARRWLLLANKQLQFWQNKLALAEWNFETNITEENKKTLSETEILYSDWYIYVKSQAQYIQDNNVIINKDILRQLRLIRKFANPSRPQDVRELKDIQSRMAEIFSTARTCQGREECSLESDLIVSIATSRDPDKLKSVWQAWRDAVGPKLRPLYVRFVQLLNKGAQENGYRDYGDYCRDFQFDNTPDLEAMCDALWERVKPLYIQLHAYVRRRLRDYYGEEVVSVNGAIQAHLLGDMWSQNWQMISDIVLPISHHPQGDADFSANNILKTSYNVTDLFQLSEEFYTSLTMSPMTDAFWKNSMLVKPTKRKVSCHGSASDLFSEDDFRIKMCTEVTMSDLHTIHHEMGHVEYFMAYAGLPTVYRTGANSAFHEAVGDTMALSVSSRKHLHRVGLLAKPSSTNDNTITDLLSMALKKVAFLPYGYLLDKWRWRVFSGDIDAKDMNTEYWKLRLKHQGIVAPGHRTEMDFDPGAKYHVPFNSPYMCYFVSTIVQFQFYKSLCAESKHQGPLHTCDFYKSKEAGIKLKYMLELGASKPWPETLQLFLGSPDLSVEPLLEYFKPLVNWLRKENKGYDLGWPEAEEELT